MAESEKSEFCKSLEDLRKNVEDVLTKKLQGVASELEEYKKGNKDFNTFRKSVRSYLNELRYFKSIVKRLEDYDFLCREKEQKELEELKELISPRFG